jgi:hypothetical protein
VVCGRSASFRPTSHLHSPTTSTASTTTSSQPPAFFRSHPHHYHHHNNTIHYKSALSFCLRVPLKAVLPSHCCCRLHNSPCFGVESAIHHRSLSRLPRLDCNFSHHPDRQVKWPASPRQNGNYSTTSSARPHSANSSPRRTVRRLRALFSSSIQPRSCPAQVLFTAATCHRRYSTEDTPLSPDCSRLYTDRFAKTNIDPHIQPDFLSSLLSVVTNQALNSQEPKIRDSPTRLKRSQAATSCFCYS